MIEWILIVSRVRFILYGLLMIGIRKFLNPSSHSIKIYNRLFLIPSIKPPLLKSLGLIENYSLPTRKSPWQTWACQLQYLRPSSASSFGVHRFPGFGFLARYSAGPLRMTSTIVVRREMPGSNESSPKPCLIWVSTKPTSSN